MAGPMADQSVRQDAGERATEAAPDEDLVAAGVAYHSVAPLHRPAVRAVAGPAGSRQARS